jgi:small subunit ribosomal protein S20
MPRTRSAIKQLRKSEKRRLRNQSYKSRVKTYIKKALAAIQSGSQAVAEAAVREAVSIIDRTAERGVFHRNKAARLKSRLMAKFNAAFGR